MVKRKTSAPRVEVIDLGPRDQDDASEAAQGELFSCSVVNLPVKDDVASMDVPIFSLAKQPDRTTREYKNGPRHVRVQPSAVGAATIYDKDLLLYIASYITARLDEARRLGEEPKVKRTVRIDTADFLSATGRGDGGAAYERVLDMLRRLRGTTIETNIPTGDGSFVKTEGFSAIDHYAVLSERKSTVIRPSKATGQRVPVEVTRVLTFEVTISEWMYEGIKAHKVLTLDRAYYRLASAIERRLYEIARKHAGDKAVWWIGIDKLALKVGTRMPRYKFRDELRAVIEADRLPDFHVALDTSAKPDNVVFYARDTGATSRYLMAQREGRTGVRWFSELERYDNLDRWRRRAEPEGSASMSANSQPSIIDG